MVWLGLFLFSFVAYQLWGTGIYTSAAQERLGDQLVTRVAALSGSAPSSLPSQDVLEPPQAPTKQAGEQVLISEAAPAEGEALGRIQIPEAEVDHVVVSGVTPQTLRLGPGHMPWTPLPGQPGNAVVSGHRTTYGAPFFHLDQVEAGDEVLLETLIGTHIYRVREILVVQPTDVWVTEPRPGAWLTLTTCTPRYSAAQRLVIIAELVDGPNFGVVEAASTSTAAEPG